MVESGVCGIKRCEEEEACVPTTTTAAPAEKNLDKQNGFVRPCEILPEFIYLGCYDDYYNIVTLKVNLLGITHTLNTVPGFQLSAKHTKHAKKLFTCHIFQEDNIIPFHQAIPFLAQCEKDNGRVLVFCMSGNCRSAAFVIAYLMKCKGWSLGQSYQWVKERRPSIKLTPDVNQQLQEYEQNITLNCLAINTSFDKAAASPEGMTLLKIIKKPGVREHVYLDSWGRRVRIIMDDNYMPAPRPAGPYKYTFTKPCDMTTSRRYRRKPVQDEQKSAEVTKLTEDHELSLDDSTPRSISARSS